MMSCMKKKKTAPKKTAKKAQKPFLKKPVKKLITKGAKRLNDFYKEVAEEDFEEKIIVRPTVFKEIPTLFKEQEDYDLHEDPAPVPAIRELPEEDSNVSVILSMKDVAKEADYELEAFTPVKEDSSDKDTTVSDLQLLNNQLALCNAALPHVHSIQTLCTLSTTVQNLIRTRRGVKKLEYGSPSKGVAGRVFEVIE